MEDLHIIIPARKNSKGAPFKNRKLFQYTIDIVPQHLVECIIVSTDDEHIIDMCKKQKINYLNRPAAFSTNEASIKSAMEHFVQIKNPGYNDTILMLYLTYPERQWAEVELALKVFNKNKAKSLLCKQTTSGAHPYLCLLQNGLCGTQLVEHDLYRRQDYPKCFEISHYICLFKINELSYLNNNMYNDKTIFYDIKRVLDIDTQSDLDAFNEKRLSNKINIPESIISTEMKYEDFETRRKVLLLGNDKNLNNLDINDIPKDTIIIGINRSWMKLKSDYLFFNDVEIFLELLKYKQDLSKLNIICSDWLYETAKRRGKFNMLKPYLRNKSIVVFGRVNRQKFPDSITAAMDIFDKHIFVSDDRYTTYYVAGTSLKFNKEKNHFWTKEWNTMNDKNELWYTPRFEKTYANFKELKNRNFDIVSVTPDSKLNDIFPYIPLSDLKKNNIDTKKKMLKKVHYSKKIISTTIKNLLSFKKKDRVFVISGGESINDIDLSLLVDEDTIVINKTFFSVPNPSMFVSMDNSFVSSKKTEGKKLDMLRCSNTNKIFVANFYNGRLIEEKDYIYDPIHKIKYNLDIYNYIIKAQSNKILGETLKDFYAGENSGFCGLQLAYILGYKEVYLLGIDLTATKQTHFHGGYGESVGSFTKKLEIYKNNFIKALIDYNHKDSKVKIFSCSPNSKLNKYIPYVNYKKVTENIMKRTSDLTDLIVVSYYTKNTPYEKEALKTIESCKKLDLNYDIVGIDNLGDWQANTRYKAKFMLEMLDKHTGKRLLWVDCDAIIRERPVLFENYEADIAVRYQDFRWRKNECLSGTIYMENNDRTKELCKLWLQTNIDEGNDAKTFEQWNLDTAIQKMKKKGLIFKNLPPGYCFIFDHFKNIYKDTEPIIEHFQLSRTAKKEVNKRGKK